MEHRAKPELIDLGHLIEDGMTTYKGLPGPHICDYWTRDQSAALYDDGSTFQIGRIDMVANTGTYLDAPFHRFADGADLAGLRLEQLAALPGVVVRAAGPAVDEDAFTGHDLGGKAVLIHTGWDRHWRTEAYQTGHPYLTEAAALLLVESGAALVGIDSHNIDDTARPARPVHTILLGANIPICEHMTNLGALPDSGFEFAATPPRIVGMGTFPVRAFARIG